MSLKPEQVQVVIDFVHQDFAATQAAQPDFVYRSLLVATEGECIQVLFPGIAADTEQQVMDLARVGILIPLLEATDAFLVSDAWQRTIDPESTDPTDNPTLEEFQSPTDAPDRIEVLIIEHYWEGGHDAVHSHYLRDSEGKVLPASFVDVTPKENLWSVAAPTMENLFKVPLDLNDSPLLNGESYVEYLKNEGHIVRRISL